VCGSSYHLRQTMIFSVVLFIFYRALIALPGVIIFKFITCHNVCSQAVLQKYHLSSQQILLLHTLICKTCRKGKHDVTIFSGSVFYRMFCNEQNIFLSLFGILHYAVYTFCRRTTMIWWAQPTLQCAMPVFL